MNFSAEKPGQRARPGPLEPEEWTTDALCSSSGADWFADPRTAEGVVAAQTCFACPVIVDCLLAAFGRGETHGIWGGTDFNDDENYCGGPSKHWRTDENTSVRARKDRPNPTMICLDCKAEQNAKYNSEKRAA